MLIVRANFVIRDYPSLRPRPTKSHILSLPEAPNLPVKVGPLDSEVCPNNFAELGSALILAFTALLIRKYN